MPEPYIRARDLTKKYRSGPNDLLVFDRLNLDVHRGEMLALVGESGAGKSTLLHLLGGLDSPSSGTIHYETFPFLPLSGSLTSSRSVRHTRWSLGR